MTIIEISIIAIVAIIIAAIAGFLIGRQQSDSSPEQLKHLTEAHELQLAKLQTELDSYRQQVHQYHEKTANLLVSMAAPYKEMFDHLTEGYEKLGNDPTHKILPERAGALLDGPENDDTAASTDAITPPAADYYTEPTPTAESK